MSQFAENMKDNLRDTTMKAGIFLVRLITGTILGLTIALTARNMTEMSNLLFVFITMLTAAIVLRITRNWGLLAVVILMLVLALLAVLLKLYVHTSAAG